MLGATPTILPYASGYAFWVIMATPFYSATFVLMTVLRQEGSPELAMFGSIFGALLNTALDPIFIFALHGGVNGAAMATSLSQIVTFCILMSFVLRGKTITHIAWKNFSLERKILVELVRHRPTGILPPGAGMRCKHPFKCGGFGLWRQCACGYFYQQPADSNRI